MGAINRRRKRRKSSCLTDAASGKEDCMMKTFRNIAILWVVLAGLAACASKDSWGAFAFRK